jgi:tRNA(Ile)-lysidine synthase
VHAAVVDHGLQDGSAGVAAGVAARLSAMGARVRVHRIEVRGPGGTEAAARTARYAALRAARPHPAAPVLLGHTLDDQAETVLLGLGRGSGARSMAGMRAWDEPWLRPLLDVRRTATRAACAAQDLPVWDDPHNADTRFTRVRLRHEVLPLLEDVLAGGVAGALARTATQLREDDEALTAVADDLLARAATGGDRAGSRSTPSPPRRPPCAAGCSARGCWPRASPASRRSTCTAPTPSPRAARTERVPRCREGWSWSARVAGSGCAPAHWAR